MPITDILARNAALYGEDVSLVELDPDAGVRRELTWTDFDRFANRIANALLSSGIKRGDKVAILMMNCLEWLPVYFGVLKTGALAAQFPLHRGGDSRLSGHRRGGYAYVRSGVY